MGSFLFVAIIVWGIAVGVWWFTSKALRNADSDRLKSRLMGTAEEKKQKKKKSATGSGPSLIRTEDGKGKLVLRILHHFELRDRIQSLIEQAGLKMSVGSLANSCLAMFLLGYGACYLLAPDPVRPYSVLVALVSGSIPFLRVLGARKRRLHRFEELFPETLEFVARSMRAGHAFSVALEMIHREFQEPVAGEYRRAFEEHNLGMPLDLALQNLAKRVPLIDVQFFVSAVTLQKRTGGNLAEILDKLAYVIRERFKLRGKIRAISAHGRMTGTALTLIPLAVGALMFMTNPEYIRFFFTDETGHILLGVAAGFQVLGYLIINKIVQIEV